MSEHSPVLAGSAATVAPERGSQPLQRGDELLIVESVGKLFGSFRALDAVSLTVTAGEVLGLVGPNGSGKTTLINVISGLLKPSSGRIVFAGEPVSGQPSYRLARRGINRTFQVPKPFLDLTVAENLEIAMRAGHGRSANEILQLVGLAGQQSRRASELTAADQKRLDLARALATGPRLLLVDELAAGLSTGELDDLARVLRLLASEWGLTLLVVEHLLGFLEKVTDRVTVLNAGQVIYTGKLADALKNPTVVGVFIGG